MSVHIAEATVDPLGRVVLDHLPFQPGDRVDIIVRTHHAAPATPALPHGATNLQATVLRYDDPFEPVASDDWDPQQIARERVEAFRAWKAPWGDRDDIGDSVEYVSRLRDDGRLGRLYAE